MKEQREAREETGAAKSTRRADKCILWVVRALFPGSQLGKFFSNSLMSRLVPWGLGTGLTAAGSGVAILDQCFQLWLLLCFQFMINSPALDWGSHPNKYCICSVILVLPSQLCSCLWPVGPQQANLGWVHIVARWGLILWSGLITAEVAFSLEILGEDLRSPKITVTFCKPSLPLPCVGEVTSLWRC